jgi:hypothetical protein
MVCGKNCFGKSTFQGAAFALKYDMESGNFTTRSDACPGLAKWSNHYAIGEPGVFESHYEGKGVMMMRQPEQRLISAYNYNHMGWPQGFSGWPWDPTQSYGNHDEPSLLEFAEVVQGCTVRMLTFPDLMGHATQEMSRPLRQDDVELAKRRLDKFAFVGLTEEWPLSICLWRAKFGGLCYGADFGDTRPGDDHAANETYDTSILRGFADKFDGELYARAQQIFKADLQKYGVNATSCKPCWDHAAAHWTTNT